MTRLLVAAALAGVIAAAGHAEAQQAVVISGRVSAADTGNPLPHARVVIYNDATPLPPLFTDAQGRFASAALTAGRYRLTVTKSGYSLTTVPRIDPVSPAALDVRMPRSVSISGRVVDTNGEPASGMAVIVGVPRASGMPSIVKAVATDDLGEYRVGGLTAGTYVVGVNQLSVDATGSVERALLYFPGTLTAGEAQLITVAPGDQRGGIDLSGTMNPALPFALSVQLLTTPGARIFVGNPQANAASAPQGTSSIRGRVTRTDGVALAHVNVTATYDNTGGVTQARPVPPRGSPTDDDGRYEISELPRGTYRVRANKPGYSGTAYGQKAAGDAPARISVGDGETRAQIDIVLPKFGAISGQVLDDFGDPVDGVAVTASQIAFSDGRRRLRAGAPRQTTDDLGHYRVFNLPPGQYVVAASVGQLGSGGADIPTADISGFAPTYFPGVTTPNEARQVTVGRGQDVPGVDVALIPLPTARIAGRKVGSDGEPLGGSLVIIPSQRSGAIVTPAQGARIEPDGRFEFPNVTPGEYVIQADKGKSSQAVEGEFVSRFVTVNGADVADVLLQATPGSSISGRVVFDGDGDPPLLTFGIVPARADLDRSPLNGGNIARSEVQKDLSFAMSGIHGARRLTIDRRPAGWDLKAVVAGGVDVTDVALPFGTSEQSLADVQIILTNRLTELSGTATDARGQSVGAYVVLVFPSDRERWYPASRFMRRIGSQAAGNFSVAGLPPADYYVAALPLTASVLREGADAWQDPEFLDAISSRAVRATLTEGQKLSISAKIITP